MNSQDFMTEWNRRELQQLKADVKELKKLGEEVRKFRTLLDAIAALKGEKL